MEEVIVVILQIFFEVFFNAIVSLPFDWFFGWKELEGCQWGCAYPFLFVGLGAGCGWVSLLILPKLLIPLMGLRLLNLVLAPTLAESMSAYIASVRTKKHDKNLMAIHFMNSFLFTLAFAGVRLAYAK